MIEDNYNDDIELLDEPEVVDAGDGTLYEHWKIEVDPGQTPVRIDKFLSERILIRAVTAYRMLPMQGLFMSTGNP